MFDYTKIIPQRLKYYRIKHGYTQMEIAKMLKIHHSSYANWEVGSRRPSIEKILHIADIYETSIDLLLGRTDMHNGRCSYCLTPQTT
jgi:transcriptional regulator with XRE-family HTH domain